MTNPLDQLAQRFYEIDYQSMPACPPWDEVRADLGESYLRLAREALRQMRWSRHSYRWANPESLPWYNASDPTEEPTIAPPDWLP